MKFSIIKGSSIDQNVFVIPNYLLMIAEDESGCEFSMY